MGGLASEISARCRKEGELLFERHRRLAAEARLTDIQMKLAGPTHLAKKLPIESQKKNPNLKRIASSLQDGHSTLTKNKSPREDAKIAVANGISAEIAGRDAKISALQAQLAEQRNVKVQAERNGISAKIAVRDAKISALQAELDEQRNVKVQAERNGISAEIATRDSKISDLQAQLDEQRNVKVQAERNDISEELVARDAKISALQAQIDEQEQYFKVQAEGNGTGAELAPRDPNICALQTQVDEQERNFKLQAERDELSAELAWKDTKISALQAQITDQKEECSVQAERYEEILRDMTRQVNEALSQRQLEYENLARVNEQLAREHAEMLEERVRRDTVVAEDMARMRAELYDAQVLCEHTELARMDIMADRERICQEMAEMARVKQMHDWYDSVSDCHVNGAVDPAINCMDDASENQDPEAHTKVVKAQNKAGMDSLVWKQRELLIRLVRKSANQREDHLNLQDDLKRKAISLHYLQQKVEELSHELNAQRLITDESFRLQAGQLPNPSGTPIFS